MATNKIDLSTLTMAELRQLQTDAAAIIATEDATALKVSAFCDEVYALARQRGVTMEELVRGLSLAETVKTGKEKGGAGASSTAKYRQGAKTWTGRGYRPRWVTEHLAAGGKLEDLAAS